MAQGYPYHFSIDFERHPLLFQYRIWLRALQVEILLMSKEIPECFLMGAGSFRRQISHGFWEEFLKGFIWKLMQSSPDKFPIDFEMDSLRIPYGNDQELSKPISYLFWKVSNQRFHMEFPIVFERKSFSIWKWTQSFPDQVLFDFARGSFRISYGNSRPISHWFGKDSFKGFHMVIPHKFPIDVERLP